MANETHRARSDQSRSGRAVIFVQIISWCAVGALLILRGVATLTGDELFYDTDNRTTSVQMTTREPSDTKKSRAFDENEGTTEGERIIEQNSTSTEANREISSPQKGNKINPTSAILITVGTTMLVIGPTLLLARFIDTRRHGRESVKFSKVDPPPSYEEVADKAPRYSSLFQVTDSGELVPLSVLPHNSSTRILKSQTKTEETSEYSNSHARKQGKVCDASEEAFPFDCRPNPRHRKCESANR
ncbi:uncharacterized protein LOC110829646 isoform X2 [Zootermopsis nevadensis]|nr:uncharacterized protein LOC110829646 isoform X2 [Zootermopsis nevadensis]